MPRPPHARLRPLGRTAVLVALSLVVSALLVEGLCRLYAIRVYSRWREVVEAPTHYFRPSPDPVLVYELRPGTDLEKNGRILRVNEHGIRDASDDLARSKRRVAVLGDSVVFGNGISQEETLPRMVQQELDPEARRTRVFNFGVAGYGFPQIAELLRDKDAVYDVHRVVYLLNPNDFARRDTVYEGADNGLYRMYRRPRVMSLWFVRKAVYRLMKRGGHSSVPWYRWFFEGNEEWGQRHLLAMQRYAESSGIDFRVVLLPAGVAYREDGYALSDQHAKLGAFLAEHGIPYADPVAIFGKAPERYFDHTDHLVPEGNRVMARVIAELLARPPTPAR